jgi:AcrR family transcriptional regulator
VLSKTRRFSTPSLELFAEGGYRAITVAAIAESAGVTVQTVYAAFGSEAGTIKALLAEMEDDAQAPFCERAPASAATWAEGRCRPVGSGPPRWSGCGG